MHKEEGSTPAAPPVQHERGPRKPKHPLVQLSHPQGGPLGAPKDLLHATHLPGHHHHHHHHHLPGQLQSQLQNQLQSQLQSQHLGVLQQLQQPGVHHQGLLPPGGFLFHGPQHPHHGPQAHHPAALPAAHQAAHQAHHHEWASRAAVHLTSPLSLSPMSPTSFGAPPQEGGSGSGPDSGGDSGGGSAKGTPSESSELSPTSSAAPGLLDVATPSRPAQPPASTSPMTSPTTSPDNLSVIPAEPYPTPPASMMLSHQQHPPPSPSLLHLLMSAEKCQELLWGAKPSEDRLLQAAPLPLVLTPTWEVLQETTARLLFMAVRWVRCLAPFQTLSKRDQLLLLQESWKELFLLHLAQWSIPWDLSALLESPQARDRLPQDELTAAELKTIHEIMSRFRQLSPDVSECGCMKAVILFTPETSELCDVQPVEMLQDQAQCILSDYVRGRYPRQPTRFGRLLLLVPSLRSVRQVTVEQLFFRETIGEIPITRLLGDMYHMEGYA